MSGPASFEDEYEALRRGSGVVELADWSSMTVSGADRQKFLHNFCTNDVNGLVPGGHCEAFFTNAKGRVIGHGWIDCREDELAFVGAPGQSRRLIEHLERYIIRDDVKLRDTSGDRTYIVGAMLPSRFSARRIQCVDTLGFGALVEVATQDLSPVRQALREQGYKPCSMAAFESLRIEAGTPLFGIDFTDQNLPQEVNRDRQAISFTKGCYLGQETVARIDALGHVNQKLVGVRFMGDENPAVGTELMNNGLPVGRVTSATYSPQLRAALALAMVRRESNVPGTLLESVRGECEVISLPLTVSTV
jgi:folate-binding protein YgfZ